MLWFEAPGHARLRLGDDQIPEVPVFPDMIHDLGDIALAAEKVVVGRVTDARGQAIADGRITVRRYANQLAHTIYENGPPIAAVTAADGTFRVGSLAIGDVAIEIEVPGQPRRSVWARCSYQETGFDLGEIRFLDERTEISGRVIDDQGEPVADARVHANEDAEVFACTNASGVFALSARTAQVGWVTVQKAGFIGYSTRVEDPHHVQFEIQRAFYLEGRVRDARTDEPLALEDLGVCEVRRREVDGTVEYVG